MQSSALRVFERSEELKTGCLVPENGFYRVIHSQHRLPKEVTLTFGQSFPRCSKCAEPVSFELIRSVRLSGFNAGGFNVALYQLPEIVEEQSEESLAS